MQFLLLRVEAQNFLLVQYNKVQQLAIAVGVHLWLQWTVATGFRNRNSEVEIAHLVQSC